MPDSPSTRRALGRSAVAAFTLAAASIGAASFAGATEGPSDRAAQRQGPPDHSPADTRPAADPQAANQQRGNQQRGPSESAGRNDESPGNSGEHKQTICHRTRSATNPYVVITVDFHAVDGELVEVRSDHAGRHDGPVFDPATMTNGDEWGDIIPPFTTEDGMSFDGQNWTDEGQAIFDAGCTVESAEAPPEDEVPGDDTPPADDTPPVDETPVDETPERDDTVTGPNNDAAPDELDDETEEEVLSDVVEPQTPSQPDEVPAPVDSNAEGDDEPEVEVLDETVVPTSQQTLPRTGSMTDLLTLVGGAFLALGSALTAATRRFARSA